MLRAVKNVFLDRTNRSGVGQVADHDEEAAASTHCSESSGSDLANDRIWESEASSCTSLPVDSLDDSGFAPNHLSAMHHDTQDDAARDPRQNWHFTQYGYRQITQHNHQPVTGLSDDNRLTFLDQVLW